MASQHDRWQSQMYFVEPCCVSEKSFREEWQGLSSVGIKGKNINASY